MLLSIPVNDDIAFRKIQAPTVCLAISISALNSLTYSTNLRQYSSTRCSSLQAIVQSDIVIHQQHHQIYLWAKWLGDRPEKVRVLNKKNYPTWADWVNASQDLSGWPPLRSKHQTGDAVNFYWATLDFDSEKQPELLTGLIREAGGTQDYTPKEREQFGIPDDDNYMLEVIGYPSGEDAKPDDVSERSYFHIVYRPSEAPCYRVSTISGRA